MSDRDAEMMGVGPKAEIKKAPGPIERMRAAYGRLKDLLRDPALREGAEASARTVINTLIAVADTVPGAGSIASWGADAAKMWARFEYHKERARVAAEGGDVSKVKLSRVDLTPDVSLKLAVGTEVFELVSADFLPTHAIEAVAQLRHDLPRMKKALARFREIAAREAVVASEVNEAAKIFDVTIEE